MGACAVDYSKLNGLVPAVVQDEQSNEVLMVGFMNAEAFQKTLVTGYVTFFSRSRNELWLKGETSGNRLRVVSLATDCDDDTVLARVMREGDGNVSTPARVRASRRPWRSRHIMTPKPNKLRLGIPKGSLQDATVHRHDDADHHDDAHGAVHAERGFGERA